MAQYFTQFLIAFLVLMNLVGFFSMLIDKQKAKKHQWRIKESTLFGIAIFGGSLGSILGMSVFRHKTKHWYFVVGMPLILFAQVALFIYLTVRFG